MSYSQLSRDPLDLEPQSDIALDEDLFTATPDSLHSTCRQTNQSLQFDPSAPHPAYYDSSRDPSTPTQLNDSNTSNQSIKHKALIIGPADVQRKSYPFSIVWGALPLISWCLPCVGHLGICDSNGQIHDFHGPYHVEKGRFMAGPVLRFYQFTEQDLSTFGLTSANQWDQAVHRADLHYSGEIHNIVTNNCHHHVAAALTHMGLKKNMSQVDAAWLIWSKGRFVSGQRMLCSWALPSLILWAVMIGIIIFFTTLGRAGK